MKTEDVIVSIGYLATKLNYATYRYKEIWLTDKASIPENNLVFSVWHGHLFKFIGLAKYKNFLTIASESRDGEIGAKVLNRYGFTTARGSSSSNGAKALIQSTRIMNEKGLNAVVAVDGSKGPRLKVKPGAIYLAKLAGKVIIPTVCYAKREIMLNTWDRFSIPYPFSTIKIYYGNPIIIDKNASKDEIGLHLQALEESMLKLTQTYSPQFFMAS